MELNCSLSDQHLENEPFANHGDNLGTVTLMMSVIVTARQVVNDPHATS
jgi:hypothetical protein